MKTNSSTTAFLHAKLFGLLRYVLAMLIVSFAALPMRAAKSAEQDPGVTPAHLVISYKCAVQNRAAFRAYMEAGGIKQFEHWKKDGKIGNYLVIFSSVVNEQLADMWVFLDFEKFTDLAKWQEIERAFPGGLAKEGLALAAPQTTAFADSEWHGDNGNPDHSKSIFMVLPYIVTTDEKTYHDFVEKYTVPQMEAWVKQELHSYRIFSDQYPANSPWQNLLLLEYSDIHGLAMRDVMKDGARAVLGKDPEFKRLGSIKLTLRKEGQPGTYLPILPKN